MSGLPDGITSYLPEFAIFWRHGSGLEDRVKDLLSDPRLVALQCSDPRAWAREVAMSVPGSEVRWRSAGESGVEVHCPLRALADAAEGGAEHDAA